MPTTRPGFIWSGSEWVAIGQEAVVNPFYYQATAPVGAATGAIWIESDVDVPSIDSSLLYIKTSSTSSGEASTVNINTKPWNMPWGVVSYTRDTTALLNLTTGTETALFASPALIPTPNRLYEVTYTIGLVQKTTGVGNIDIRLKKDNTSGTELDRTLYSAQNVASVWTHSKTVLLTSTQMGTTSFIPTVTVQTNTDGAYFENTSLFTGAIMVKDIGPA